MPAASLLLVFILAKAAVFWGRAVPFSAWSIAAYFWQDVLVAAIFGAIAWTVHEIRPRSHLPRVLYWVLALYAALNIPIATVLSTPLTLPMLRATSGTLADSLLLYATFRNVTLVLLTLAAAAILPRMLSRMPPRGHVAAGALALVIAALGPTATTRIDTMGLHRNVVVALAGSALPRVDARAAEGDWTSPPFGASEGRRDVRPAALRGIARGRNIILVALESTAAQYLRLYGATEDVTPNLERLAASGVVFDNAYAVYPESIKGLFSVLCSIFPAFDTTPRVYETAPCRSVAAELRAAGYATGMFHSGRFAYLGMESIIANRGYDALEDAGDIGGQRESSFGVDEESTVARVLAWIDARPKDRPFFLTYLPIAGHHPYDTPTPGPFRTREEIGRYRNAVRYGDQGLGALMDGVRARGLEERTLWIVIGDHGEAFGQHDGNYGHTFHLYEENVRVPFVVSLPGAVDRPQRSAAAISLIDVAPTILDLAGAPIPAIHQGRSALAAADRVALFFTDYSLGLVGLRDGRWKFIHELSSRRSMLFDLERDPRETANIASAHPGRIAAYERRLRDWSAAQKAYIGRRP